MIDPGSTSPAAPDDPRQELVDVFGRVFDVVVVGSGYAGVGAALTARRAGLETLLVGERGDLLWESGRGFSPRAGRTDDPGWTDVVERVAAAGGGADGYLDGALAEVVATRTLIDSGAHVLYYAIPVAVQVKAGATAVVLATKAGVRAVTGRQVVDATESASVTRLAAPDTPVREQAGADVNLVLQRTDWSGLDALPGLTATAWPTELVLSVPVPAGEMHWRRAVLAGLESLEAHLADEIATTTLSHLSFEPVPWYAAGAEHAADALPDGLHGASPATSTRAIETLADRFMLGVEAASQLTVPPSSAADVPHQVASERPAPVRTLVADVCVAGGGTGGAIAAIAAARAGATVVCVEALTFLGGIGTGGGIHSYAFGVPGGLQNEVDGRVRELMNRFRRGPLGDGPFNPWAKMLAFEELFAELAIDVLAPYLVFDVEVSDGVVSALYAAGPDGVVQIRASSFVDGSGDGDLAAMAGAEFTLGREGDGLPHAYSQSSGGLRDLRGRPRMRVINFDAGYCDPTDPQDLTRARLEGIVQYSCTEYTNLTRPTYIAPALGLRQGRQVVAEYMLSLDDQISGRTFGDVVGYTGSHYENHSIDCEFETDESVFWSWANRGWTTPISCELPYRSVVPRGLRNVWLASRCAGLTQDAHYATRMQRDVQRLGEVAGIAAALSARADGAGVRYRDLRELLDRSGALERDPRRVQAEFGRVGTIEDVEQAAAAAALETALAALDSGSPGKEIWWLYRHPELAREAVLARLADPDAAAMTTWLAACTAAMWHERAAEPRLLEALERLEYGYDAGSDWVASGYNAPRPESGSDPLRWMYTVPNWLTALALLRRCGTGTSLAAIRSLLERPAHGLSTLTTAALTVEAILADGDVAEHEEATAVEVLDLIEAATVVGGMANVRRYVGRYSQLALAGDTEAAEQLPEPEPWPRVQAVEDHVWRLRLAVLRLRRALGLPAEPAGADTEDPRSLVRRAFRELVG